MKIGGIIIMIDKLNVKGKVTIKLINKDTGKVDYEKTIDNVILQNGAYCCMYALTGIQTPSPITRTILFDSNKNPVVPISGTWGDISDTGTALQCTITCIDDSNASYTFRYLTLDRSYPQQPVYSGGYFANDRGSNITKASNQILTIQWTISISYSSPP
jgi:hypothetical protein